VHLVGFIIKKFVMMHGHKNVKERDNTPSKRIKFKDFFHRPMCYKFVKVYTKPRLGVFSKIYFE
jgi:hypothetical protein